MRIFLIAGIVCLFEFSCSVSNEKKAQKLIGEILKETMNDYSSYEPVKFDTLDTVFTSLFENKDYYYANENMRLYSRLAEETLKEAEIFRGINSSSSAKKYEVAFLTAASYQDSVNLYKPIIDSIEKAFKPIQDGWKMTHIFRSNNAIGAKTIGQFKFFFDVDLTRVTDYKDITKTSTE